MDDADGFSVVPVRRLIEEALERLALQGDEAERCRAVARRLEDALAVQAAEQEETLSDLWGSAAAFLIADHTLPEADRETLRRDVSRLRREVTVDGLVLPFGADVPARLLRRLALRRRQDIDAALAEERAVLGGRLAGLLGKDSLSSERRLRLAGAEAGVRAPLPGAEGMLETDGAGVAGAVDDAMHDRLAFFRALNVARLDATNAYDPDAHDAHFEAFAFNSLAPEDRTHCVPIVLHVDGQALDAAGAEDLLTLIDTDRPVKILVTVDGPLEVDSEGGLSGSLAGWRARLAERALGLGSTFVLQATAAQARLMAEGFADGLRHDGPALFFVATGTPSNATGLSPYDAADLARTARLVPAFVYDPSHGDGWAARFRLDENPQPEATWPRLHLPGTPDAEPVPVTPAEVLALDERLHDHFLAVPPGTSPKALLPVAAYLEAAPGERGERFPYVELVGENDVKRQVLCTRPIVRLAAAAASRWRLLQEQGGIHNSHAVRAVQEERARLEKAFEEQKAAIADRHRDDVERVQETLAQQVVANIAAGLLGLSEAEAALPAVPAAAPKVSPKTPAPVPKEAPATPAADVEEESLSFDEPYIDSPDCTSCDECLNINANIFAYNDDDKAYIKNPRGGPYRDLVTAAENCPARIIHPGKPLNPDEPGLDELVKRAEPYL